MTEPNHDPCAARRVSEAGGPTFLGIGAPRCGTTWLHRALRLHPQVWLPPIKEVHYFDSLEVDGQANVRGDRLAGRLRRHFAARVAHYAARAAAPIWPGRELPRIDLDWDRRFFCPGGDIDWYRRLFAAKRLRYLQCGEVTPAYIALSDARIDQIRLETDARKFLVMLRDPVESSWSGFGRKMRDGAVERGQVQTEESITRLLTSGPGLARRQYASNLERWFSHFPRECFFIGYFEDLNQDPASLYRQVCEFLEVDPPASRVEVRLPQPANSSRAFRSDIPPRVASQLAACFLPELERLASLIGGRSRQWAENAARMAAAR